METPEVTRPVERYKCPTIYYRVTSSTGLPWIVEWYLYSILSYYLDLRLNVIYGIYSDSFLFKSLPVVYGSTPF